MVEVADQDLITPEEAEVVVVTAEVVVVTAEIPEMTEEVKEEIVAAMAKTAMADAVDGNITKI